MAILNSQFIFVACFAKNFLKKSSTQFFSPNDNVKSKLAEKIFKISNNKEMSLFYPFGS